MLPVPVKKEVKFSGVKRYVMKEMIEMRGRGSIFAACCTCTT
jgi:hypothetical protein